MRPLHILLVDDHEVVRLGLKALLGRYPRFEVVAEAGSGEEALQLIHQYRPNVVVMDIRLPGKSGIETAREMKVTMPEVQIVILTAYAGDSSLAEADGAHVSGYVLKEIGSEALIRALEAVSRGAAYFDPSLTRRDVRQVREVARAAAGPALADLTEQELRVLSLVARGKTNKAIASALYLSNGTVRNYVSNVLRKIGATNRAEAAAHAVRYHIWEHVPDPDLSQV